MRAERDSEARGAPSSRLGRLVDWFIPPQLMASSGDQLRKAQLIVWSCLGFLTVIGFPFVTALLSTTNTRSVWFMSITVLMAITVPFALRAGLSLRALIVIVIAVPTTTMGAASYAVGGIHAPSAQAMLLVTVYGFFLGGPRHGLYTLIAISALHVGLGIQASSLPGEAAPRTVGLIAINTFLYMIAYGFHNVAERALDGRDHSNRQLSTRNRQLSQARDDIERALFTQTRLLTTLSHEVRTPMSGIVGLARLLQDADLDDEQRERVSLLLGSSEALLAVVDDVLDLARMESGQIDLAREHFRLDTLLDDTTRLMSGTVREAHIDVRYDVHPDVPEWLCGDQGRVRQILLNLLGNAIRFTRAGFVEVRAHLLSRQRGDVTVRFEVEDTGVGMNEQQRARVFDAFAQVHESGVHTDHTRYSGTGLGLTICRELVSLMGGDIGVDSQVGRGSRFWFELAMTVGENPSSVHRLENDTDSPCPTDRRASDADGHAPVRVLVAEDNLVNRRVAQAMLRSLGCFVHVVCTGAEAVSAVCEQEHRYDVVFMDRWMPDMDGIQATVAIRSYEQGNPDDARIAIVGLSASAGEDERNACLQAGMDDYLVKPATRAQLASMLRRTTLWRDTVPTDARSR